MKLRSKTPNPRLRRLLLSVLIAITIVASGATPSEEPVQVLNWALTDPGCCSSFSWADNSNSITFLDKPPNRPSGVWKLHTLTKERTLEGTTPTISSPLGRYLIDPTPYRNSALITDTLQDKTWHFPHGGPLLYFSPNEQHVLFSVRPAGFLPNYVYRRSIYTARVDGSELNHIADLIGDPIGWFPDGERLLLSGMQTASTKRALWIYDMTSKELQPIVEANFLDAVSISPGGRFIVFVRSLSDLSSDSGLWIYDIATTSERRLTLTGSYRWHPSGQGLLIIPPRGHRDSHHTVWWANVMGGPPINLTTVGPSDFHLSNFEWQLSPGGGQTLYRHSQGQNLWILDFGRALDKVFSVSPTGIRN